jgi:hypothetical protein
MTDEHQTVVVAPPQGVVGVASGAVDALRSSPMLLVMILLNCMFIVAAAYYLRGQQDGIIKLVDKTLDRCLPEAYERKTPRLIEPPNEHQG